MLLRTAAPLIAVVLLAGCHDDGVTGGSCPATVSLPIFGGSAEPSYLQAGPELARAVALVSFAWEGGESRCSGLFIDRRWVLTARHCAPPDASAEISIGASGGELERTIAAARTFSHPSLDLRLVELTEEVADITPVPV